MPEAGAVWRVRDAMDAWLDKGLPADFDQLRADLRHILDCIPERESSEWCPSVLRIRSRNSITGDLASHCWLPAGHEGDHRYPTHRWLPGDSR